MLHPQTPRASQALCTPREARGFLEQSRALHLLAAVGVLGTKAPAQSPVRALGHEAEPTPRVPTSSTQSPKGGHCGEPEKRALSTGCTECLWQRAGHPHPGAAGAQAVIPPPGGPTQWRLVQPVGTVTTLAHQPCITRDLGLTGTAAAHGGALLGQEQGPLLSPALGTRRGSRSPGHPRGATPNLPWSPSHEYQILHLEFIDLHLHPPYLLCHR